jgi:PPOX class probable F420-dependent enzyme
MAEASLGGLPGWARNLLETEPVGHLGLIDYEGLPRVLPVTFAVVGETIWSAIDEKPKRVPGRELARVRWLQDRPETAFTVDHYSEDWSELAWVQVLGRTTVAELDGNDAALEALSSRYPSYRTQPPRGPLLKLQPGRLVWWRAEDAAG